MLVYQRVNHHFSRASQAFGHPPPVAHAALRRGRRRWTPQRPSPGARSEAVGPGGKTREFMGYGDFPMKSGDFPMKNADFPNKNGDFTNQNGDLTNNHGEFRGIFQPQFMVIQW